MTFMQCRPNVFDVGPTLHTNTNVLCLLGDNTNLGVKQFPNPPVIQSVCLQVGDQVGAKDKGFELLLIDVAQVYMNLL